jgi:hypothetical protein
VLGSATPRSSGATTQGFLSFVISGVRLERGVATVFTHGGSDRDQLRPAALEKAEGGRRIVDSCIQGWRYGPGLVGYSYREIPRLAKALSRVISLGHGNPAARTCLS